MTAMIGITGLASGSRLHPQKRSNGSAPSVPTKRKIKNTRRGSTEHTEDLAVDLSRAVTSALRPWLRRRGMRCARLSPSVTGCFGFDSAVNRGQGSLVRWGLLHFSGCTSPGGWILVHSDAVFHLPRDVFCTERYEDFTS